MEQPQSNNLLQLLPQSFENFLEQNKINKNIFTDIQFLKNLPRYIRVKPTWEIKEQDRIEILSKDLNCNAQDLKKIAWIPDMYSLNPEIKIASSSLYKSGIIYGIDLASAACAMALNVQPGDTVLDLCCAPAGKLCYIADMQKLTNQNIKPESIIGVDISENRLATSNSIVKKYGHADVIKLVQADGTTFQQENGEKFDKVLVDAECTHDGSVKHLLKFIKEAQNCQQEQEKQQEKVQEQEQKQEQMSKRQQKLQKKRDEWVKKQFEKNNSNKYTQDINKKNEWSHQDFEERFMDQKKMENTIPLQKSLLKNGFQQLKQGGIMIYSTCSFARSQNEDVVEDFLEQNKDQAELLEVYSAEKLEEIGCQRGFNPKMVRFDPINNNTGGMFIAKIKKN